MIIKNKAQLALLFWIVSFWVITAISPLNRYDWLMENILFFVFFGILVATYRIFQFSFFSYFLITIFFTLHLIGAHYTYSEVPFGFSLSESFNFNRNHFDRIVHFLYGILLTYPVYELLVRHLNIRGFYSYFLPLNVIVASSATFEIIETLFVLMVKPDLGEAYLGTQGDVWDAQKDMALAFAGSLLVIVLIWMMKRRKDD